MHSWTHENEVLSEKYVPNYRLYELERNDYVSARQTNITYSLIRKRYKKSLATNCRNSNPATPFTKNPPL